MGFHAFSLDPRTVLGVGPGASMEEIHEAYRAKSKKHHPDRGGDEWAFRMVARAYEVLKTTAAVPADARPWEGRGARPDMTSAGRSADWSWSWGSRFSQPDSGVGGAGVDADTAEWPLDAGAGAGAARTADPGTVTAEHQAASLDPARVRTVDVELIWTRFENDGPVRRLAERDADDVTLSVCMVISWPETGLVDRTAEFPQGADILHALIDVFERLHQQKAVVAARSRIEDGRFVGWLSYPDVLTAQDAVLTLRDIFRTRSLTIKLQTRDERVPFELHAEGHAPVMSQAS
jgi:DnaJ domain